MRLSFLLFILMLSNSLSAQDELLLMNGKKFKGLAIDTTSTKLAIQLDHKKDKKKIKSFYRDEVFSIRFKDSGEQVYFQYDPLYENSYTIDQMRLVVAGKSDALYRYKTKWIIPTGLVVGAASAYFLEGSVFTLIVPIIYTGLVQIPVVKIQKESITSNAFIGDEFYLEGYNRSARLKRTKQALLSSLVGVIAGFAIYEISQ